MAYIYKIINDINDKIYIGKTLQTPEKRFKQHCRDSVKSRCEKRPLYDAMNKYGIEHFHVETIEECSDETVNDRETYWIEYYGSFKNGYNATTGGDGKHYLDYDLICETYKQVGTVVETAKLLHSDTHTISDILKNRNIKVKSSEEINRERNGHIVNQYDLQGNYIATYPSAREALYAVRPEYREKNTSVVHHIMEVCKGKRKTAYGYIWKFPD